MLTRCPHCQTTFRVGPDQLKVRQGKVRCGECRTVFDALDALSDEVPAVPVWVAVEPQPQPQPEAQLEFTQEIAAVPESEPEREPEPEPEPELEPEPEQAAPVVPALESQTLPEQWSEPDVEPASRGWPWAAAALILLVMACGQLLFIYRTELAMQMPEVRPALVAACEQLGCDVPYPRKVDRVGIETSDLAPEGRDRLLLSATLKNRATFVQEHPHLELTLTDNHDEPIVRKVLAPVDYLAAGKTAGGGFAARGEIVVKLLLDVKDVPAVGYRLYLFYP